MLERGDFESYDPPLLGLQASVSATQEKALARLDGA